MIEVTGTIQRQAWIDNVLPPVEQVRPGLWSIPVPMPDNPLRYVTVYALETSNGVAIVDAGWDRPEAWDGLVGGLTEAGFALTDITDILVTHIHADHYGLAGRVREESGARILMHPADAALLQERYVDTQPLVDGIRSMLITAGAPADDADGLSHASMGVRSYVSVAQPDVLLEDGDTVKLPGWDIAAIWTPGHSPGHLFFYERERRLAISGDHVLPRITPNISLHSPGRDPLADFLDSLLKVRDLDCDEVLPAHEYRFRGLDDRVDELCEHHANRLQEIETAVREAPGSTCWEVAPKLHWSRPWDEVQGFMRRAAVGETFAHVVLLERQGRIRREGQPAAQWFPAASV